jgi:hypothetical protein
MALRKKHVRRIVLALLVVGVLGPLVSLVVYAAWLRGGAYGRALEAELASRLRCEATVCGARPTGVGAAAADSVDLSWTVGDGRLALHLGPIRAEHNSFGWYVTAGEGSLTLAGPAPWYALGALNQRLVQTDAAPRLMAVTVNRLKLDLDLDPLKVQSNMRAIGLSDLSTYQVLLLPPDQEGGLARHTADEVDALQPTAMLRLDPTSGRGVFAGLRLQAKAAPLSTLRGMLKNASAKAGPPVRGTADVAVDWRWPEARPKAAAPRTASIEVRSHQLNLGEWTQGIPGGPIAAAAELAVTCLGDRQGPLSMEVLLTAGPGTMSDETVRWLAGLPAGIAAAGPITAKTVAFDRLTLRCRIVGDRGQFGGARDPDGTIPIMTCRILGVEVPILKASGRPFDAKALWAALAPALWPPPDNK